MNKFDIYIDDAFLSFYAEWKSNKYNRYSQCLSYCELKTLLDSVNSLRKYMGWEALSIKEMIEDRE